MHEFATRPGIEALELPLCLLSLHPAASASMHNLPLIGQVAYMLPRSCTRFQAALKERLPSLLTDLNLRLTCIRRSLFCREITCKL